MKAPKHIKKFSLNGWNKYDFIPVRQNNKANSAIIVHDIGVYPIEGIDQNQGGIFVSCVEQGGKIIISLIKMVFDGINPNIDERWMITLPTIRDLQEVFVDNTSVKYNDMDKTISNMKHLLNNMLKSIAYLLNMIYRYHQYLFQMNNLIYVNNILFYNLSNLILVLNQ